MSYDERRYYPDSGHPGMGVAPRRFGHSARKLLGFGLLIVAAIVWGALQDRAGAPPSSAPVVPSTAPLSSVAPATTTNAVVVSVVDGDTLHAQYDSSTEVVIVRLLGVNTPETVDPRRPVECFGKEASAFAKSILTVGRRIRLDEDPLADNVDKYQRLLRNVVLDDGTDFNTQLVRDGYAYAYVSFPQDKRRKAELKRLEAEAKQEGRGLWGKGCATLD